jgi:very-short-patch-repair endonuclease
VAGHEVDFLWPTRKLVVEFDSWEFHRGRDAFEKDRRRDADLLLAGYRVLRITWRRLVEEPEAVIAQIATALAGSSRP